MDATKVFLGQLSSILSGGKYSSNDFRNCVRGAGIATGYGLDTSGIESRRGARFSAPVQTQPPIPGFFPGVKRPERGVDHSPYLGPRLKKE